MSKGIFIIGTDTEVGKTVVCAGLMQLLLENGCKAAYFKPVASGVVVTGGVPEAADAAFVRAASGFTQRADLVTPFVFVDAVSPHFAARLADRPIDRVVIRQSMDGLKKKYDLIVAEGAGGAGRADQ
jgi:dethiobiotin synthetase